ncbi:MAG TPA: flagellar hook-associated protein FlgK [Kineosporiaceae bacterium]|nr:flagellar hook-associated protein FlgK [Kineosporiaceae bacterium]
MSGFSSLNVAVSGLAAAQRAMDVTGQNVVNANTPGYSRQRVELQELGAQAGSSFFTGHGAFVGGVTVAAVSRIRGAFVEAAAAAANGRQSALASQTDALSAVQTAFAEPGSTGLQAAMDSFYASWHDLAINSTNPAAGSVVIQKGIAVADQLHALSSAIGNEWDTARNALADVVTQANQAAKDLADINGKVAAGLAAGRPVNELEDQRDLLTRKLATLVGGVASVGQDGQASVSVNGVALVTGTNPQSFSLAGAGTLSAAAGNPPKVMWGTTVVPVESGSAAGYLAVLGGDLPTMSAQLDAVATGLRDMVNTVHQTGFQADGSPAGAFFAGSDAATLTVVPTDPSQLAVTAVAGTVDGSVAQRIADLSDERLQQTTLGTTGPSAQWRTMTTMLGVKVQSLKNAGVVQDSVVAAAEAAVQTDAGVNLDEEMTNLLQYQRSYQAAARVVSTVDDILDTLINHTGIG